MAMTKERLEGIKNAIEVFRSRGEETSLWEELIAEVERLQQFEPKADNRMAEDPALRKIREARAQGHGERDR